MPWDIKATFKRFKDGSWTIQISGPKGDLITLTTTPQGASEIMAGLMTGKPLDWFEGNGPVDAVAQAINKDSE